MPIRVLPVHLVNKIAAGEVIERPASIVKELVENALDAGATRIEVTIEDGGTKRISVADDGAGMDAEDLALAFAPHATSKLADEDDLFRIHTMGFRGEALASIASVSHARIRTCQRGADGAGEAGGSEIEASGAEVGEVRPCAAPGGTTVTVRDLFYNTPARRKFLRTANTEGGHVAEQVTRLALPHPHVAFTLRHNDRVVHNLAACESTRQRVGDLFGQDLAEALLSVAARPAAWGEVAGLLGPPSAARASGKWQYVFLNGRFIRDRRIAHAIREAYRGLIDPNRWPVVFLFLRMEPSEVDVNVHPTKIEVRFTNGEAVHGHLLAALRETLQSSSLTPSARVDGPLDGPSPGEGQGGGSTDPRQESLREALADFFKSAPAPQPRLDFPPAAPAPGSGAGAGAYHTGPPHGQAGRCAPPASPPSWQTGGIDRLGQAPAEPTGSGEYHGDSPSTGRRDAEGALSGSPHVAEAVTEAPSAGHGQRSGSYGAIQIHNSYLVVPCEDGVLIIDQHALHERLLYNDLRRRLTDATLTAQRMLIPQTLTVTAQEAACLQQHAELLGRLGVEVEPFGPNAVAVQSFPSLLAGRGVAVAEFLREFLDKLRDEETADEEQLLEDVLAMMACKGAVKAGQPLSGEEIDALLRRRESAEKASACPHGRPTTLKLTLRDLEKQFQRT